MLTSDVDVRDLVELINAALKDKPAPKKLAAYFEHRFDDMNDESFFTPKIEIEWGQDVRTESDSHENHLDSRVPEVS